MEEEQILKKIIKRAKFEAEAELLNFLFDGLPTKKGIASDQATLAKRAIERLKKLELELKFYKNE